MPSGRYAEIFASQFIVVAGDNLLTWHTVLHAEVQPAFGHLSLLRTALETAVNARWILDPSISHAVRIARGVAAQWVDWDERRKYEETTPNRPRPEPPAKTGAERRADLERERAADGIAVVTLNATEAARRYVVGSPNGAGVYRLLSAFVHGTQWSLLASDRALLLDVNPPPRSHLGQVTASEDVSVGMTRIVVDTYAAALKDLASFSGQGWAQAGARETQRG